MSERLKGYGHTLSNIVVESIVCDAGHVALAYGGRSVGAMVLACNFGAADVFYDCERIPEIIMGGNSAHATAGGARGQRGLLGAKQGEIRSKINDQPLEVPLPATSGVYTIEITWASGTRMLRAVESW